MIVHGPNAGIDAVKTVKKAPDSTQGVWFIGARPPALLADNNYSDVVNAAKTDLQKVTVKEIVAAEDFQAVKGEPPLAKGKVRIYYTDVQDKKTQTDAKSPETIKHIDVDHYVVSQGQSPFRDGSGAVGNLMKGYKASVSDAKTPVSTVPFEPVYDNDFELPTVAVSAQLGSVRAAVSAHNHALPAYIQADSKEGVGPQINFTADNPNTIKAYVLVNYPQIANLPGNGSAETKVANENLRNEVIDSFVKYVVDFRTKSFNTEPIRDRAQGDDGKENPVRAHNNNNNWGINAEKSKELLGILDVISEHITQNTDSNGE